MSDTLGCCTEVLRSKAVAKYVVALRAVSGRSLVSRRLAFQDSAGRRRTFLGPMSGAGVVRCFWPKWALEAPS